MHVYHPPEFAPSAAVNPGKEMLYPRRSSDGPLSGNSGLAQGCYRKLSGNHVASSGKPISTKTITTMIRNIGIAARAI